MRGQVARKDKLGPDVVRPQIGVRPARFVITSELRGYESANSSPPIEPTNKQPKIVTFPFPLDAQCMSIDGMRRIDCLVLAVWEEGARLKVDRPQVLAKFSEFFLLFTSSQKPVFRQCKRVATRGYEIELEYHQKQAAHLSHMEYDT